MFARIKPLPHLIQLEFQSRYCLSQLLRFQVFLFQDVLCLACNGQIGFKGSNSIMKILSLAMELPRNADKLVSQ